MIKTKNSKKKRIGLILCSLFVCLCSILCIVPFKQEKVQVSADSIIVDSPIFESSALFVPTVSYGRAYTSNGNINHYPSGVAYGSGAYSSPSDLSYLNTYFEVKFRYNQETGAVEFYPNFKYYNIYDISTGVPQNPTSSGGRFIMYPYTSINLFTNSYDGYISSLNGTWLDLNTFSNTSNNVNNRLIISQYYANYKDEFGDAIPKTTAIRGLLVRIIRSSSNIDISNITHMSINMVTPGADPYECKYQVTYYDSSQNYVQFQFFCGEWSSGIKERTYYFADNYNFTDNEYYNQGYQQGQQAGYNTGYSAGETAGYNDGFSIGQTTGYNNGYSDGMEESNQYTFLNLVSATIDAPVKYFQSLFNFELLGVNLQGFLTGLFTLCIIVTIVKLCLGG